MFIKLLVLTILIRLAITFFETPRAALGPELTKDYDRRNLLNGMGLFFGYVGAIVIGFVMLEYFLPENKLPKLNSSTPEKKSPSVLPLC